jgi:hypothetical protein
MRKISTADADVLIYDASPRRSVDGWLIAGLLVIEVILCAYPLIDLAPLRITVAMLIVFGVVLRLTRVIVEFDRSARTVTFRRRYVIRFPDAVYDLDKFEGVNIRDRPTRAHCVELQSATISVFVGRLSSAEEASRTAAEITEYTGLKPISLIRLLDHRFSLLTLNAFTIMAGALTGIGVSIWKMSKSVDALNGYVYVAGFVLIYCVSLVERTIRRRALRPLAKPQK